MSYEIFEIVDASHDDDALYPVLSAPGAVYPVETNTLDGRAAHFQVSGAKILEPTARGGLATTVTLPSNIKWDALITDSRLIIYSTKYDKGGGWSGWGTGALIAVGANAVSKARAAHRRKGKVLVGHIRYPWIIQVGGSPKTGWKDNELLRFQVDAQSGGTGHRHMYLDLVLPKDLDATRIAHEIGTRCALYRLANDPEMSDNERSGFEAVASSTQKRATKSNPDNPAWAWYKMPTNYRVNATTARPKPKEPDSASP